MRKHILYLASGSSRRFGENKLLYRLQGKPMFLYGLETLILACKASDDCTITVVSRHAQVREIAGNMGVRTVDSPDSEKGISYTIRAAIASLGEIEKEDYLLFAVADQPWLSKTSVRKLLALADGDSECASLCWEDRPGNPTLFSARLAPELLALEGDTGGRAVLRRHRCAMVHAATAQELEDIDTQSFDE